MSSKKEVGTEIISEFAKMAVRHQNEFMDLVSHMQSGVDLLDSSEESNCLVWAKNEIAIACKRERDTSIPDDEWDYGVECYKSAMRAYESLLGDGHSGFSIGCTQNILNCLIDGRPLTPIEGMDDEWRYVSEEISPKISYKLYQNKRYSSLFKHVYDDGVITYSDVESHCCVDIAESFMPFHSSIVQKACDIVFPVTFPYYPKEKQQLHCEFLDGAFAILYSTSRKEKPVKINKYFEEMEGGLIKEISRSTYARRKLFLKREELYKNIL